MVHIPDGIFWMGSGPDDAHTFPDEQPRHQVTLSPYWIARVPVTQKLYAHVMGRRSGYTVDDRLPVSLVSWLGAVQFCNRLSQHHCLARVYRQVGGVWVVQPDANGYRLATEAEWEYAARGEDGRIYPWGDTPPSPEVCWGVIGSAQWKGPYPVGGHPAGASALGLLDMVGNVRELVGDGYGPYSEASVVNPQGPDLRSCAPSCVVRGIGLRVASRTRLALDGRADQIGFRVARGNSPPAPRLAPTASKGDPTATLPGVMPTQSPPHAAPSRHASPMQIVLPQRVLSLPYRRPDEVPREETVRLRPFRRCPCCPAESPVPQGDLHEHLRQAHGLTVDASGRIVSYRGGGS
jgi:formylglycine-generating enzyme required for sulfatase activity